MVETPEARSDDRSEGETDRSQIYLDDRGTFARGSNNFMYPYQAATGKVYLTTYGPEPAKFYEIDPYTGAYTMYEPGDYQMRMIAETSDGHLWTVSCYQYYLYEFDPETGAFVNAYQWPVQGDNMVCVVDPEDRIYTVKNYRLYSFDTRTRTFQDHGLVMPEGSMYNRGQHAQFGPDGNLYSVSDGSVFRFDPRSGDIEQIVTREQITADSGPSGLTGNDHLEQLDLPWLHGTTRIALGAMDNPQGPKHFSHNMLFRCNVETGQVETYPLGQDQVQEQGVFYDPVDRLHYYTVTGKEGVILQGLDWEKREVVRRIELPYVDQAGFMAPSLKPRRLWLTLQFLGRLVELDLASGDHRLVFENPMPAEVRCLAVAPGRKALGVAYDCGHVFERSTTTTEFGRSLGSSYTFRICYGPAAVSADKVWVIYPINCAMGVNGTGVLPTAGAPVGRHVTDLVPIHLAATGGDTFLVVHRGSWGTHQEEGRWDGRDEMVANLVEIGKGVFRLHASDGRVEELSEVPCASLAVLADGSVIGCDPNQVWRLAPEGVKPEGLCAAPPQPVRIAAGSAGDHVVLATTDRLYELDLANHGLIDLGPIPFTPERGLFCFGEKVVLVGHEQIALLTPDASQPVLWIGEIPGKVGPVAAPDEDALYTVDRTLTRISWASQGTTE